MQTMLQGNRLRLAAVTLIVTVISLACADSKGVKKKTGSANLVSAEPKLDPQQAKIQLPNPLPRLGNASQLSTLQVPILDLTQQGADMVQILRCKEGYIVRTPTGQDITTLGGSNPLEYNLDQLKWAWTEAFGNNQECRLVGTNIARTTFEDLAAGDGRWFYLINPCVSATRSTTGKEDCSYNLVRSGVVEYKNNLKPEFIAKSQQLAEMEGLLSTHFGNLIFYARQIRDKTRVCEDKFATDQARGAFLRGIVSIAAGVVGAVVGAYIGGPQGAIMGASLMLGLARGLMAQPPAFLECPEVDDYIEKAKHTTSLLDVQVAAVVEVRTEMTKLEAGYGNLDSTIGKQTGTGQATDVTVPQGSATGSPTPPAPTAPTGSEPSP